MGEGGQIREYINEGDQIRCYTGKDQDCMSVSIYVFAFVFVLVFVFAFLFVFVILSSAGLCFWSSIPARIFFACVCVVKRCVGISSNCAHKDDNWL